MTNSWDTSLTVLTPNISPGFTILLVSTMALGSHTASGIYLGKRPISPAVRHVVVGHLKTEWSREWKELDHVGCERDMIRENDRSRLEEHDLVQLEFGTQSWVCGTVCCLHHASLFACAQDLYSAASSRSFTNLPLRVSSVAWPMNSMSSTLRTWRGGVKFDIVRHPNLQFLGSCTFGLEYVDVELWRDVVSGHILSGIERIFVQSWWWRLFCLP